MTTFEITAESEASLDLSVEAIDSGWDISGDYAIHYPCNAGFIKKKSALIPGKTYVITYELSNYVSGLVRVIVGTNQGVDRTANGTYTDTIVANGDGVLQFYSNGFLRVKTLQYYEQGQQDKPAVTISFHEDEKHWGSDYSLFPDMMMKFINKFICFKDGQAWEQNTNETRNNFFGQQYSSVLQFYVNINPTAVKNFYSIRLQSNKPWGAVETGDVFILPREGKANGQSSRLKQGNFKNYQGNFFADFLRDATDPRFTPELTALMKGALLQGQVMQITLTNSDTVEVRMLDLDVSTTLQNYSY